MRRLGFAAVLSLIPTLPLVALPQPFLASASVGALAGAETVVAADFNGDGLLDLAAGSQVTGGGELIWLEAVGAGFVRHAIAGGLNRPVDLAAGDLDCDGDSDLVLALDTNEDIVWYENVNRASSWVLGGTIDAAATGVRSVALDDLNRDGRLDVVAALSFGDEIRRYRNVDCSGTSWAANAIATGINSPQDVATGDLDGDGRADVVAAVQSDDLIAYWSNPVGPGGWTQVTVDSAFDGAVRVTLGDVDGDGDLDVAAAANAAGEFAWWRNPGASGVWAKVLIGAEANALVPHLADLDRDGDLDLAVASPLVDSPVGWYENTAGDGTAWSLHELEVGLRLVPGMASGDFGGDGDIDLAVAADHGAAVLLFENASTHRSALLGDYGSLSYLPVYREISDWEMGDFNRDGRPDLVLIDRDAALPSADVWWLPNEGLASTGVVRFGFEPPITSVTTHLFEDLVVGDFDGDGDDDVVIGERDSVVFGITLCRNTGVTPPWSCGPVVTGLFEVDALAAGDLDRDGDLDVAGLARGSALGAKDLVWWELAAAGATWTQHPVAAGVSGVGEVEVVDLDADSDLDLVVDNLVWYRNDGGSPPVWTAELITGVGALTLESIALGDLDSDFDLDLAVVKATASGPALAWLENDLAGTGTWVEEPILAADPSTGFADLGLADLDGDGDPDLVAGLEGVAGDRVAWFENDLDGLGSWALHPLPPPQLIPAQGFRILTADFDRDGDPDVVAGEDAARFASWLNGGGQFALATTSAAPTSLSPGEEGAVLAIDTFHRGRTGEAALELAALALTFKEDGGGPLATSELVDLISIFRLFRDDGSGTFDAALDAEVANFLPPALTDGLGVLALPDGLILLEQAPGPGPVRYFLTAEPTATATGVGITSLVVTHAPELGSAAENLLFDTPLSREAGLGAAATIQILPAEVFADDFESGDTAAWTLFVP